MKLRKTFTTGLLALAVFAGGSAHAGTTFAAVNRDLPAGTDTFVSVPVNNNVEVELAATSKLGTTLNFPAASLSDGAYDAGTFPVYYVRFIDGPAAGLWASITANSASSITIDDAAVAALASGTETIRVYKHHTLASVFPTELRDDSAGGKLTKGAVANGMKILFYSTADALNKGPGSGGIFTWFNSAVGFLTNASRPLLPDTGFIIRNDTVNDLTYFTAGEAPDHPVAYLVKAGVARDTHVGTGYPVTVTAGDSGVGGPGRQILLQSNAFNSSPGNLPGIYTWFNPSVGFFTNANKPLEANSAYVLRQNASEVGGKATVVKPY